MKHINCNIILTLALLAGAIMELRGQSYSINWSKIAGGGGTSGNGQYSLSGTVGQADAGRTMVGGNYALTGGYWSLIGAVQTFGSPRLTVSLSGSSVIVSWPNTGNFTLQQESNLNATAGWATSSYIISTLDGTNSITLTAPTGNLFFRLVSP